MKFKFYLLLFIFINFKLSANELDLKKNFIPLKDFIILKYELFFKENAKNIFQGAGMFGVAYENIDYKIKINDNDETNIFINAIIDKER